MNTLWKQALIAAALGTAVTASAQYTSPPASSPGATPDPSPMTKPATGAATSSPQDRMPANRDQEAHKGLRQHAGVGTGGVHRARKGAQPRHQEPDVEWIQHDDSGDFEQLRRRSEPGDVERQ